MHVCIMHGIQFDKQKARAPVNMPSVEVFHVIVNMPSVEVFHVMVMLAVFFGFQAPKDQSMRRCKKPRRALQSPVLLYAFLALQQARCVPGCGVGSCIAPTPRR